MTGPYVLPYAKWFYFHYMTQLESALPSYFNKSGRFYERKYFCLNKHGLWKHGKHYVFVKLKIMYCNIK